MLSTDINNEYGTQRNLLSCILRKNIQIFYRCLAHRKQTYSWQMTYPLKEMPVFTEPNTEQSTQSGNRW